MTEQEKTSTRTGETESEANARLIAAAPDLLAALKQWAAIVNEWYAADALEHLGGNVIKKLGHETDAAIAKAEPR